MDDFPTCVKYFELSPRIPQRRRTVKVQKQTRDFDPANMEGFNSSLKRPHEEDEDDGRDPDSFRPLQKLRAETYAAEVPCSDWVLSTTAPNHVAVSRASFTRYTEFPSVIRFGKTGTHGVMGIGDVEMELLIEPGSTEVMRQRFADVLHVPGLICNICSVTRMVARGWSMAFKGTQVLMSHVRRGTEMTHYADKDEGLYKLALPFLSRRPSKLVEGENCVLAYDWPMAERHAWEVKKHEMTPEEMPDTTLVLHTRTVSPVGPQSIPIRTNTIQCGRCFRTFPSNNQLHKWHKQYRQETGKGCWEV